MWTLEYNEIIDPSWSPVQMFNSLFYVGFALGLEIKFPLCLFCSGFGNVCVCFVCDSKKYIFTDIRVYYNNRYR